MTIYLRGKPEVPGGETERIRREGGDELRQQLGLLLAGQPAERCIYALASALGTIGVLCGETEGEALDLMDAIATDAKNIVLLNYADVRDEAVRQSEALRVQAQGGKH